MSGQPYTVIGVVQEKIKFPELAEVWLPLEPGEAQGASRLAQLQLRRAARA